MISSFCLEGFLRLSLKVHDKAMGFLCRVYFDILVVVVAKKKCEGIRLTKPKETLVHKVNSRIYKHK